MKRIADFLCMCSGAHPKALLVAPSGRMRAATLGLLLILVGIISSFTAGYALKRVFLGEEYAALMGVVGGVIWGTLVFCIDRLMLLGMDRLSSPWLQFLARLPLAVIISLVMSKPLVLRVSQTILDKELRNERLEQIQKEIGTNAAHLNEQRKGIQELLQLRRQQETQLNQEPDSFRYRNAKEAQATAEERYERTQSVNGQRIAQARREIQRIRALEPIDQAQQSRIAALTQQIARDQRGIEMSNAAVASARDEKAEATREWQTTLAARMKSTNDELEGARELEAKTSPVVDAVNQAAESEITRLMTPNLINEYSTLKRITAGNHPDSSSLRAFEYSLDFLFLALELTPIMMKLLSSKGPLDDATEALEFKEREKILLGVNSEVTRMQQVAQAAAEIEKQAIENWKETQIQNLQNRRLIISDLRELREQLSSDAFEDESLTKK